MHHTQRMERNEVAVTPLPSAAVVPKKGDSSASSVTRFLGLFGNIASAPIYANSPDNRWRSWIWIKCQRVLCGTHSVRINERKLFSFRQYHFFWVPHVSFFTFDYYLRSNTCKNTFSCLQKLRSCKGNNIIPESLKILCIFQSYHARI